MSGWNLTQYTLLTYSTRKFYSPSFISSFKTFGFVVYKGGSTLLQICQSLQPWQGFCYILVEKWYLSDASIYKFSAWKNSWRLVSKGWLGEILLIGNWNIFMSSWRHRFVKLYLELKACMIDKKKEFRIKAYINSSWYIHMLIIGITVECEKKPRSSVANVCSLIFRTVMQLIWELSFKEMKNPITGCSVTSEYFQFVPVCKFVSILFPVWEPV